MRNITIALMFFISLVACSRRETTTTVTTTPESQTVQQTTVIPPMTSSGAAPIEAVRTWMFEEVHILHVYRGGNGQFLYADVDYFCHDADNFSTKVCFVQRIHDPYNFESFRNIRVGARLNFCIAEKMQMQNRFNPEVAFERWVDHNGLKVPCFRTFIRFNLHSSVETRQGVQESLTNGGVVQPPATRR